MAILPKPTENYVKRIYYGFKIIVIKKKYKNCWNING